MTIQTLVKRNTIVQAMKFEGGMKNGLAITRWIGAGTYRPMSKVAGLFESLLIPTFIGDREVLVGEYVVRVGEKEFLPYQEAALVAEYGPADEDDEHWLVQHARTELDKFDHEDPEFIESLVKAIKGFTSFRGHSGGSSQIAIHMLTALIKGENLLPLTNDPEEWDFKRGADYGTEVPDLWQNKRNSKAISENGGKTYWLVDEDKDEDDEKVLHLSDDFEAVPEIDPEDLKSDAEKAGELRRLGDDPEEWNEVEDGIWQSFQNPDAFSDDTGKTFWLKSETTEGTGKYKYDSIKSEDASNVS